MHSLLEGARFWSRDRVCMLVISSICQKPETEGDVHPDGHWEATRGNQWELDVFKWVPTGSSPVGTWCLYTGERVNKDKHKEQSGMMSAECLHNMSLVLQSPCRGNKKGVVISENNVVTSEGNFNSIFLIIRPNNWWFSFWFNWMFYLPPFTRRSWNTLCVTRRFWNMWWDRWQDRKC